MTMIEPAMASNIGSLLMAVISGILCVNFWRTSQEKEIFTIKVLAQFFGFFSLFQLFLGSRFLFNGLSQTQLTGISIFAHAFMYLGLAHFSRIGLYIHKPEWRKYVFSAILLFGAVSMYLMIQQWTQIVPLIAIPSLIIWIGLGTVVFYDLARKKTGAKRIKMALIGTGFLIMSLAGPLHGAASTGIQLLVIEATTILGLIAIGAGVYWKELISSE